MHALRTRFKKDIVAEFLVPCGKSSRVVILCCGMPCLPSHKKVMEFLAKKGYFVFSPRYRGSWESGGEFLKQSPEQDVLNVIDGIYKGFTSILDKKAYRVNPSELYVFGSSFGGSAAILASRDPRVTKSVAFSPVVDWQAESKIEPLDWLYGIVKEGFGEGYRVSRKNWNKLSSGKFYNPQYHIKEFDPSKIFLVHAKDDDVVPYKSVEKFAKKLGCNLALRKRGGHMGLSDIIKPMFFRQIYKFLRK